MHSLANIFVHAVFPTKGRVPLDAEIRKGACDALTICASGGMVLA